MAQKPSIPKGTRDFNPVEMARRNYIFDTIRDVFYLFGFQQIETPAMENLSTLMGKYGEEGDKLLFKILNSGDFLRGVDPTLIESGDCPKIAPKLCEKGLRYDLTVPFARFVVMHRNDLSFPFKRFQIQPVWRADRPQKGRYREFYQCDADIIGSDSLLNEIDLLQLIDEVFHRLGIRITIKLNNRKILAGIAELAGEPDKIIEGTDRLGLKANLELDVSLARGLNYYTGTIIEVKARDVEIGSITGGGRYDNLTGVFGLPGISGVGISFGADRIYDVLNALDLYPSNIAGTAKVMFTNFGMKEAERSLEIIKKLRESGIAAEIYPDAAKIKKQMGRADALGIPFVAIVGETELQNECVTLKNMSTGEQRQLDVCGLIDALS